MTSPCDLVRETLSARADGEREPMDHDTVAIHLSSCHDCRSFEAALPSVVRASRLSAAAQVPDLTASILAASAADVDDREVLRRQQVRAVLGLVGLVQAALALGALLGEGGHLGRELATWQLGLGVGFAVASWQPRRAAGLLPMVAVLGLAAMISGTADLVAGTTTLMAELSHLVEVAGVLLVWAVARDAETDEPVRVAVSN